MPHIDFLPCGDTAFSVQYGDVIDRDICIRVLQLKEAITRAQLPGIVETVPTFRSLLVHYDPMIIRRARLTEDILNLAQAPGNVELHPKHWFLPVCFDPEYAWDLEEICTTLAKDEQQVLDVFTSTQFFVYMVGFTLGYLYLGDLPEEFTVLSRRPDPRTKLEIGAVCTAKGMAVVHSIASPGGWNVIGKTPSSLFDIRNLPPSPFRPGDELSFQSISKKELGRIKQQVEANTYQLEYKEVGS